MSSKQTLRQSVAGAIRAEMARNNYKARDLSCILSISESSAQRRMNGEVKINLDELDLVARWLEVPVFALLPEKRSTAKTA